MERNALVRGDAVRNRAAGNEPPKCGAAFALAVVVRATAATEQPQGSRVG